MKPHDEIGELLAPFAGTVTLVDLPFAGIHSASSRAGDIDAAHAGIFRHRTETFALSPPVDWWDEPYRASRGRAFFQNSFVFADPLLTDPRFSEVLTPLAHLFVDWLLANPRDCPPHPHPYAWHDHAVAGRLVTMAFVLREGLRRGQIDRVLSKALAAGVLEHARFLLADDNYAGHYNHGLFSDAALALAARSLAPAGPTTEWSKVAQRRFAAIVNRTVDQQEAVHLEHSPYYHNIIQGALARFSAAGLFENLDLPKLVRRMEGQSRWLIAPDGCLPPIGDTPMDLGQPRKSMAAISSLAGMRIFANAGYAIVREGDSALFVTAAHHPTAHKHADDGSFCLYEKGQAVVLDAGDPGYDYKSAERRYGTSPAAHATVCIDGFDWARGAPPYGSGIVDAAERGRSYAVLVSNPMATSAGGSSRRALVYLPGQFLFVLDEVEADPKCELARNLPIAPGLIAATDPEGTVAILDKDRTVAQLVQVTSAGTPRDSVDLAFGRRDPVMGGFCFPTPETSKPRYDIRLHGPVGHHPRAFVLIMGEGVPTNQDAPRMSWTDRGDRVDVEVGGLTTSPLRIGLREDSIELA